MQLSIPHKTHAITGIADQVTQTFTRATQRVAMIAKQRAVYKKTYQALDIKTDRQLADMGFHRADIRTVARKAARLEQTDAS